jgi:hypothetical protein
MIVSEGGGSMTKDYPLLSNPRFIELVVNSESTNQSYFKEAHKRKKNRRSVLARIEIVVECIQTHDVVVGIFDDDNHEEGVGYYIIKGQSGALPMILSGEAEGISFITIPCKLEQAVYMSQRYGDMKN